jgi:hypothetical protein
VCHRHHAPTSANLQSCDLHSRRRFARVFRSSPYACVKMALSSADINSVGMMAGSGLVLRRYCICRVAKSHVMTGDTLVEVLLTQCLHSLTVRNVKCLPQCLHALSHKHEEIVCTTFVPRNVDSHVTCASLCTAVMAGSYLVCCLTI